MDAQPLCVGAVILQDVEIFQKALVAFLKKECLGSADSVPVFLPVDCFTLVGEGEGTVVCS